MQEFAAQPTECCCLRWHARRALTSSTCSWFLQWQSPAYPWHLGGQATAINSTTVRHQTAYWNADVSLSAGDNSTRFGSCWLPCRATVQDIAARRHATFLADELRKCLRSNHYQTCRRRLERSRHGSSRPKCCHFWRRQGLTDDRRLTTGPSPTCRQSPKFWRGWGKHECVDISKTVRDMTKVTTND